MAGAPAQARGEVDARLRLVDNASTYRVFVHPNGKPAQTRWCRRGTYRRRRKARDDGDESATGAGGVGSSELFTLLEAQPLTGRTHQIRAHMAHMGHPIVGDTKYNRKRRVEENDA